MSNSDLIKLFKKSTSISKGTRIQKLRKAPTKLLHSKILEHVALWFEKPIEIRAKTFWGEDMLVVTPEGVSQHIYRYGFFEEGLTRMVLEHLKPGMTFLDIGAHFGYFTLLSSILVGNKGQVHSFEPTLSSFGILKANVSNKNNVFINNCAVLSKRKVVFINDYGSLQQDILSKLKDRKYDVRG